MYKIIALFGVLAICLTQYCPSSAFSSSAAQGIVTGSFVVGGSGSGVSLLNGQDIACYNYSLNTPLSGTPSVVTAINGFGVNPSNTVYFSVRPLLVNNAISIPFQIRTQWKYAYWNSITVNFLAESRPDIDAGTRIIDAGLSPCSTTSNSTISLYYANQGSYTNIYVFLSGFEASTPNSVIDIRISGANQVGSGFSFQVSTQAGNTINTVWVGYVAYSTATSSIQYVGGSFQQNGIQNSQTYPINTQSFGPSFFGLSGISFNTNTAQGFSATINPGSLAFSFSTGSLNFVSENYIIFVIPTQGNAGCGSCQGFPYSYNAACVTQCPQGTFASNGVCSNTPATPVNVCAAIPNSSFNGTYCICNTGYTQQGGACVQSAASNPCSYIPNSNYNGQFCICNQGYVQSGSGCILQPTTPPVVTPPVVTPPVITTPTTNPCGFIPNSYFNGTSCQCSQGYIQSGSVCVPSAANNPCSFISNSNYNGFTCVCNTGYVQSGQSCVLPNAVTPVPPTTTIPVITTPTIIIGGSTNTTTGPPVTCPQGTYNVRGRCENCARGCGVCTSNTTCVTCLNGFNVSRGQCVERCGKGFRVFLQCDDGNAQSGDGCSSNCTIENGWTCSGGTPNTPDRCTYLTPVAVLLNSTGQVHTFGNIYANVRINYLPTNLSQNNCSRCNDNILMVNLTTRPLTQPKISSSYIRGSSYTFSVRFEFTGEPISEFSATVQINPALAQTYFQGVDISQVITININPAVMALQDNVGELTLP